MHIKNSQKKNYSFISLAEIADRNKRKNIFIFSRYKQMFDFSLCPRSLNYKKTVFLFNIVSFLPACARDFYFCCIRSQLRLLEFRKLI